ncbi:carboxyl-terminal processing protease [Microtetraspora sp. NBRC 13810]|nr:carboxyl-terminal processing protease [Microtetraspora sp. NBRC 13810]
MCASTLLLSVAVGSADATGRDPQPCVQTSAPSLPPPTATKVSTVGQVYNCLLDHYFARARLDNRDLLAAAFAGLTTELEGRGIDQADAVMPPLAGDRAADWGTFAAAYERITSRLPDDRVRQAVAGAAIDSMIGGLHDNHVRWTRGMSSPSEPGTSYGLGFTASSSSYLAQHSPQRARGPLHITAVTGGPAAAQHLRPGDVIEAVNGAPPFADSVVSVGALRMLSPRAGDDAPVRLSLRRPATGRTWTVTLRPETFTPATRTVSAQLVDGDIAAVRMNTFGSGSADQVLAAIAELREQATLRGVVLDVRGNIGGRAAEVPRLLGALAHGRIWGYRCDVGETCTPQRTDDSVPLLGLPVAVLTDGGCASSCDAFTSAVKGLELGPVIGARTSGMVSGVAHRYALDDNTTVSIATEVGLGPDRERINGIGVPPDHFVPLTAGDLSAGRDPAMDKAVALL